MRRAFTLAELLVVIAVVATLIAVLAPGLSLARACSRNGRCLSNLRSVVQAFHAYRATPSTWNSYPTSWEALDLEPMSCPADPDRTEYTIDFSWSMLGPARAMDIENPATMQVAADSNAFHPWRNAGYLDGHAGRIRE